jgi:Flp pilus assembly protein TadD
MFRSLLAASRRHALVLVPLALLLVSACGIVWYSRVSVAASIAHIGTPTATGVDATGVADSGITILLDLARDAMRDGRLVAPQGSNAFEFYLSVLQLDPSNLAAQEALRETFPRAAVEIEGTINGGELEEARREIDLLREFDRDNFTLALLGGKLSAARNILTRQHEMEAARIQATVGRAM